MTEYVWTLQLGAIRIGWIKRRYWTSFYEHCYRGYVRFGHLDFYNGRKFDGTTI